MWFRHRQRVDAAFAKGLMFGKAVGARDERERIVAWLESIKTYPQGWDYDDEFKSIAKMLKGEKLDD